MSGVSSCGDEVSLDAFDIDRAEYKISLLLVSKSGAKVSLVYEGEHADPITALAECEAGIASLVGILESHS